MFLTRRSGISLLFQLLKIKAKAPRPENKRASAEEKQEYKKTLHIGFGGERFYFQDEMRFGRADAIKQKMDAVRRAPEGRQVIGYEYGYLSVALNPATGEVFALLLPDMTRESFAGVSR